MGWTSAVRARRVQVGLAAVPGQQPRDVGAAAAGLLGSDALLPHEVVCGFGRRHEHRHAEALDQARRVAFVPQRGEHHHRLAVGRELEELVRVAG